ncbi:MAG: cytochrome c biogenesis protein CcsA [Tannerellaceae bacterium]|nr:cytochrome c biogenesis protein CcsA [Tannerellaceae bacterium]
MKATVKRFISSYVTTLGLLFLYAVALGWATFIEHSHGTAVAKSLVYYSPLLFLVQFLFILNFIGVTMRYQLLKKGKWGYLILHVAFIIILAGALISHVFGEEGMLHIREGEASNELIIQGGSGEVIRTHTLPFHVELLKFTITRYPGSNSPSSYESELLFHVDGQTLNKRVFMNNVVDLKGYRFFQASYDRDEQGTILSVNKDVAGRNVTYAGYLLLVIGFVFCLTGKNSRFRQLSRQLTEIKMREKATLLVMGLCLALPMSAQDSSRTPWDAVQEHVVPAEHAALFGALPVQSGRGRMMPVNTFSSEIVRKLHKAEKIGTLNPDQFLISLLAMPQMWMQVPFIAYSNKEMSVYFDLTEKKCAYVEFFDSNGHYKLQAKLEEAYNKRPEERNGFDKEVMKLDEKVNILYELFSYQMLKLFPLEDDPNHTWYAPGDNLSLFPEEDASFITGVVQWYLSEVVESLQTGDWEQPEKILEMIQIYQKEKNTTLEIDPRKLETEIRYNQLNPFRLCKIFYLSLGGILLILTFISLFRTRTWITWTIRLLWVAVLGAFLFQMAGMGMRWSIGGYAPWSNSYETMVYVAWASVLGGLIFMWRSPVTFALATLFGGIILFVSGLNWMDPQINTLVPVLKSPWLMFHVAVIVAAYGFFGISFLLGITDLVLLVFLKKENKQLLTIRVKELSIANEMSLIIGLALMTIGTFLGAVWANESWGRYWGWDPKETWALVTVIVYAIVIHLRLVKRWYTAWSFNMLSVLAFGSVLMTYFGVNYFLSGMHSYGQNDQAGGILLYSGIALLLIALLGAISYRKSKRYS